MKLKMKVKRSNSNIIYLEETVVHCFSFSWVMLYFLLFFISVFSGFFRCDDLLTPEKSMFFQFDFERICDIKFAVNVFFFCLQLS